MKITGIKCYQIALPMFSTSVAGGVENYTGSLCRNIKDEEVAEWGKRYQEFNSVLSCIVEMHTDAAVSYTHLDVYKRQLVVSVIYIPFW